MDIFRNEPDRVTYPASYEIIQDGEPGDYMHARLEGKAEIRKGSTLLEKVTPGGFFGELALIDNSPRNASVAATSEVKLARIDQKRFLILVHSTPFFAVQVLKVLADRLRATTK